MVWGLHKVLVGTKNMVSPTDVNGCSVVALYLVVVITLVAVAAPVVTMVVAVRSMRLLWPLLLLK